MNILKNNKFLILGSLLFGVTSFSQAMFPKELKPNINDYIREYFKQYKDAYGKNKYNKTPSEMTIQELLDEERENKAIMNTIEKRIGEVFGIKWAPYDQTNEGFTLDSSSSYSPDYE